jgi:membrane protein
MKRIYQFKGLSKEQKKKLKNEYIKSEWKNLLLSYLFIVLSSSKPFFSIKNGAVWVLIWFTLTILLSVYVYVSPKDYRKRKKKAEKYSKKHKNADVEVGNNFFPEIGGWNFIGMQLMVAIIIYVLVLLPVSLYLQFKDFDIYKEVYMKIFIGIFADTYIVAFFNIILQIFIEFLYERSSNITTIKSTIFTLKLKGVMFCFGVIIILYKALTYYFYEEFGGLFGDTARKILGSVYIIFMLCPLIKAIKQIINNSKQNKPCKKFE